MYLPTYCMKQKSGVKKVVSSKIEKIGLEKENLRKSNDKAINVFSCSWVLLY